MFEQKEKDTASGYSKRSRLLRQYLLCGVAAAALIAAVPAVYNASAGTPVLQKNEAPGTLTLSQNAVGLPDFTQLVKRVRPAVVSVRVKETPSPELMSNNGDNPLKGTPFEQFFREFQRENGGRWKQIKPMPMEAQGSGFFISATAIS